MNSGGLAMNINGGLTLNSQENNNHQARYNTGSVPQGNSTGENRFQAHAGTKKL